MEMHYRSNKDISDHEYKRMGETLRLIVERARWGLKYGTDMKSSRAAIISDIRDLAGMELNKTPEAK